MFWHGACYSYTVICTPTYFSRPNEEMIHKRARPVIGSRKNNVEEVIESSAAWLRRNVVACLSRDAGFDSQLCECIFSNEKFFHDIYELSCFYFLVPHVHVLTYTVSEIIPILY